MPWPRRPPRSTLGGRKDPPGACLSHGTRAYHRPHGAVFTGRAPARSVASRSRAGAPSSLDLPDRSALCWGLRLTNQPGPCACPARVRLPARDAQYGSRPAPAGVCLVGMLIAAPTVLPGRRGGPRRIAPVPGAGRSTGHVGSAPARQRWQYPLSMPARRGYLGPTVDEPAGAPARARLASQLRAR